MRNRILKILRGNLNHDPWDNRLFLSLVPRKYSLSLLSLLLDSETALKSNLQNVAILQDVLLLFRKNQNFDFSTT